MWPCAVPAVRVASVSRWLSCPGRYRCGAGPGCGCRHRPVRTRSGPGCRARRRLGSAGPYAPRKDRPVLRQERDDRVRMLLTPTGPQLRLLASLACDSKDQSGGARDTRLTIEGDAEPSGSRAKAVARVEQQVKSTDNVICQYPANPAGDRGFSSQNVLGQARNGELIAPAPARPSFQPPRDCRGRRPGADRMQRRGEARTGRPVRLSIRACQSAADRRAG